MKRIGIIGAMDEEIQLLKEEMNIHEIKQIANMEFFIGVLENQSIVLVRCGIGKVNAAICTQVLISELGVSMVINTGVAGAIHEELDVLDVVVSTDVQQHDFDVTGFGYPLGEIPRMETSVFSASEELLNKAYNAAEKVLKNSKAYKGRIISGDVFVSSAQLKDKLWNNFKGFCTEMEGAAIGHTAYVNSVPFVIIRAMSDKADGSAHDNFNEFVDEAAINSKEIVKNMLRQMN
ncbi:5'-methylthioadenosine/adenosylhomocysteine nucleosidase [Alkaliphilus peptidifermentans]|uniref:adenosylhomocysteine nucleosidase n=1 Tax=Alkaliphilus peptidifermentans DSM 18978 TaxID=1120976 RepID=A0A1G5B9S5_9FIRM|nr:5'-methylthioadenosine/adenosylhomocysteine nucleosidase [Alkaliphilus peptidifermentans]SCX86945.1 methylthioadenosine nucleosidase /adenosylhomocysteine nucleosidase [Alkaliphilus peptidifermentans DSM 18978]